MSKSIYPWTLLMAGLLGLTAAVPALSADDSGVVSIQLPEETAQFKPGPGSETAGSNCVKCHSADYIYMQPPLTKEQWLATVAKMRKAFGAPIEEADVDALVNYLMSQNGKNQ